MTNSLVDLSSTNDATRAQGLIATQGFSVIDLGLSSEKITEMKSVLEGLVQEDLEKWSNHPIYRDHWMVLNLMFRNQIFADLIGLPSIQEFVEKLLGEPFILYSFTSSSMPPNGTNFSRRIHNDAARFIPNYITNVGLVIALDDFTSINGATQVLPFSQIEPEKPSEERFAAEAIEIHAQKGQALLFNARLWHSGGQNKSDAPRNALTLNFCRSFMRQHFDFSAMAEETNFSGFNEQAMKLLGKKVRMPRSLEEYYVPTEERRYQPGQG
jgi:ectoine hydroxylase-related dioxygenase (phytanoyl-CoA dioxygenase family)